MDASKLFDLKGRVALVTGASSGLGERFAEVAAANGAAVVLVARRKERLEALKTKIEKAGGRAVTAQADVTDQTAMKRAFGAAEKAFGTVDLFVANAGVVEVAKAVDMTPETWRKVMGTDLDAVFFTATEAARRMIAAGKPGSIVTIASIAGYMVERGLSAYAVAKAGVIQATRALALEFARRNIRVNAIAPGFISTEINSDFLASEDGEQLKAKIPLARFGTPGDLDGTFLLLASGAGAWMTGSTVVVDGGELLMAG
ncbi:MAG TPA: SDR family NAD(P)-dependent oxidoreductase [Xanthobacteraceae bacterium]|nr:SDR family NAD(P)-dependent oxidoreductase [Xanthobacteraceae bacterium]